MAGNRGLSGIIEAMSRKLAAAASRPIRLGSWTPAPRRAVASTWADTSKYTADNLPAIRKRKGVGRRQVAAHYGGEFLDGIKWYPALRASVEGWPAPNLAEWERKPRRKDMAAA